MDLKRCPHGHFYDGDLYIKCPFCPDETFYSETFEERKQTLDITGNTNKANKNESNANREKFLANYKSYVGDEPFLFISYSHEDTNEVEYFFNLMKQNDFRFWYDEGIKSGAEWEDEIVFRIKNCTQFIVFISEKSVVSENVKNEIHIAVKYGIEIIRIHLDSTELHGGLELNLDRKQALYKNKYEQSDFEKRFCSALNIRAICSAEDNPEHTTNFITKNYLLLDCISQGGTSKVFLAQNKRTGGKVIVKILKNETSLVGRNFMEYFRVEREVLTKRISSFAPEIIDCNFDDNTTCLVESFIEGTALDKMENLSIKELIEIIIKVAEILRKYHRNGIIHCDIKPTHIICNDDGCFIIDFGASKTMGVTSSQYIMGTPGYAAPEQFSSYNSDFDVYGENTVSLDGNENIDARTDIFCLGRTLQRMINSLSNYNLNYLIFSPNTHTLRQPDLSIAGLENTFQLTDGVYNQKNFDCKIEDPLLRAIVDKMTMERKSDRFNSMDEVIKVLKDYLKLNFE